mmetsp:Transcript_56645/g.172446  ORF Transcript_56645/g.172446 Transcript_56645/m.172446 type:complete len:216 (+) Transcript_56645:239-886(+)
MQPCSKRRHEKVKPRLARRVHVPAIARENLLQMVDVYDWESDDDQHRQHHSCDPVLQPAIPPASDPLIVGPQSVHRSVGPPEVVRLRLDAIVCRLAVDGLRADDQGEFVGPHKHLDVFRHQRVIKQLVELRDKSQSDCVQQQILEGRGGHQPARAQPPQIHGNRDFGQEDHTNGCHLRPRVCSCQHNVLIRLLHASHLLVLLLLLRILRLKHPLL